MHANVFFIMRWTNRVNVTTAHLYIFISLVMLLPLKNPLGVVIEWGRSIFSWQYTESYIYIYIPSMSCSNTLMTDIHIYMYIFGKLAVNINRSPVLKCPVRSQNENPITMQSYSSLCVTSIKHKTIVWCGCPIYIYIYIYIYIDILAKSCRTQDLYFVAIPESSSNQARSHSLGLGYDLRGI